MDSDGDTSLSEAVARFVADKVGVRHNKVTKDSRLREDLGVDGDDAYDLLIVFAKKFHVRDENFVLADHFGPEASWFPFAFMFRRKRLLPMTMQDLIDSAAAGVWRVKSREKLIANC